MSDVQGGKAISLVQRKAIVEAPSARTFVALGSNGDEYVVTTNLPVAEGRPHGTSCTCQAGQHGRLCYHVRAAGILCEQGKRS